MATPITWRNVDAPNLGDPSRSMLTASHLFGNAFEGISKSLNEMNTAQAENWKAQKDFNTNQFLTKLSQFQTPEEAEAAKAGLFQELAGMGAQVDGAAARSALSGLTETLQKRQLTSQQYQDTQQERGQRDVVTGLQEALLRASNPEEVANIKQAIGIYQGANMLNGTGGAALTKEAVARELGLVQQDRDEKKFKSDMDTAESTRKHQAEQNRIAGLRLGIDRTEAENRRLSQIGDLILKQEGVTNNIAKITQEAEKPIVEAREKFLKESPFSGKRHTDMKEDEYRSLGKTIGLTSDDVNSFLNYLKKDDRFKDGSIGVAGSTERIPITSNMIKTALMQAKEDWWNASTINLVPNSWNDKGDTAFSYFEELAADPTTIENYKSFLAKDRDFINQQDLIRKKGEAQAEELKKQLKPIYDAKGPVVVNQNNRNLEKKVK